MGENGTENLKNLDATLEAFSPKGIEVLQQDRVVGSGGLAYMSTDKTGGIITEIVQRRPDYAPEKGVLYE